MQYSYHRLPGLFGLAKPLLSVFCSSNSFVIMSSVISLGSVASKDFATAIPASRSATTRVQDLPVLYIMRSLILLPEGQVYMKTIAFEEEDG